MLKTQNDKTLTAYCNYVKKKRITKPFDQTKVLR